MNDTMTTELTKAAQQALEQLEFLNACYPHKTAADAIASLQSALTQRPAAQTERDTGPRVLREVFALCEDTVDKMTAESTEFSRGRAFEAKGIARAIGTWFQDEYCGQSHMGEPSLPAPQQATPASAPQSLLMRLAGIAAECSDPDTTDALDALIAATQQATPEPLIVKGAMAGMVDAQVRDLWPTKGATLAPQQATPATPEDMNVYGGIAAGYFADTQQAMPDPVGEPVAWRWMPSHVFPTWVYSDDQNRVADARRFMGDGGVQALYTHPSPGVPEGFALLKKVSEFAVYVGSGECSLSMSIVREIDAFLAAAQAKGGV